MDVTNLFDAFVAGYRKALVLEGKGVITSEAALRDECRPLFDTWVKAL